MEAVISEGSYELLLAKIIPSTVSFKDFLVSTSMPQEEHHISKNLLRDLKSTEIDLQKLILSFDGLSNNDFHLSY